LANLNRRDLPDRQRTGGRAYRVEVAGSDAFYDPDDAINVTFGADGTPFHQAIPIDGHGIAFEIKILSCPVTRFNELRALLKPTRLPSGTPVEVTLESVKGDFAFMVRADVDWISTGAFSAGYVKDVVFRFITTGFAEG